MEMRERSGADVWGIVCSLACAIHCAATPILLSILPTVSSVKFLSDPLFHQVVAGLCSLLVLRAIIPGWRVHRDWRVGALASFGLSFLFIAAFVLPDRCCDSHDVARAAPADSESNGLIKFVSFSIDRTSTESDAHAGHQHEHAHDHSHAGHSHDEENCCEDEGCDLSQTWGKTIFSQEQLENSLGKHSATWLSGLQPFLSPLGGCLLIVAHVLNMRLQGCRRSNCDLH